MDVADALPWDIQMMDVQQDVQKIHNNFALESIETEQTQPRLKQAIAGPTWD